MTTKKRKPTQRPKPKPKKRGRHPKTCKCPNCNQRRKLERESQSQSQPPEPIQPAEVIQPAEPIQNLSAPGGTEELPSSAEPDNFDAVAADLLNGFPAAPASEPAAGDPLAAGIAGPAGEAEDFAAAFSSTARVRSWMPTVGEMVAGLTGSPDAAFRPYEIEFGAPAIAAVGRKYLPAALASTQHPELAMLALFLMAYLGRIGLSDWKTKKEKAKQETAQGTPPANSMPTAAFTAPLQPSGRPAPERVF